jgi:hypothetical protein
MATQATMATPTRPAAAYIGEMPTPTPAAAHATSKLALTARRNGSGPRGRWPPEPDEDSPRSSRCARYTAPASPPIDQASPSTRSTAGPSSSKAGHASARPIPTRTSIARNGVLVSFRA